jgi:hypothetical protein
MPANSELVKAWIEATEGSENDPGKNSDNWAVQKVIEMWLNDEHEQLWATIISITNNTESDWVLECLGAGPLEDLLRTYASNYIDRVAEEVKKSKKFKKALSSVWLDEEDTTLYKKIYEIAEVGPPFD